MKARWIKDTSELDKYQTECGNIISQTSLLSSYTGSETDAD